MTGMENIGTSQLFWKTLFDENAIAQQLSSILIELDGVPFTLGQFGKVTFKCHPASKLRDNFLSDTFIGIATMQDETQF